MSNDRRRNLTIPGGGFLTILLVLFVGLKLTGYIHWHWVWILSPIWLPSAILLAVVIVVFLAYLIGGAVMDWVRKRDV